MPGVAAGAARWPERLSPPLQRAHTAHFQTLAWGPLPVVPVMKQLVTGQFPGACEHLGHEEGDGSFTMGCAGPSASPGPVTTDGQTGGRSTATCPVV